MNAIILEFLRQSNNIEDVWDDLSLKDAICAWMWIEDKEELTVDSVLETHQILMDHQEIPERDKGGFRIEDVSIGGRLGMPPGRILELISNWLKLVNNKHATEEQIQEVHVLYEKIHPFIDGNGRTGRIFMNWQRIQCGFPILIIKEKEKYAYYKWFQEEKL